MSADRTTEILNYLSAISREVGEFRSETNARFQRIEGEFKDMRYEISELRNEVRAITSRLDRLEARILENRADVRDLTARVTVLESR